MEISPSEPQSTLPVEHQNVPIAHEGLHNFLYSSEDEHGSTSVVATPNLENLGTEILPLEVWRDRLANTKTVGVYAVLDCDRRTQYIGYSRNVLLSLNGHATQVGESVCAFARIQTVKFPKRETMEQLRDQWLAELDTVPPGNAESSELWAGTIGEAAKAVMSEAERHAYEEKKLKLRKAMADTALTKELEVGSEGDRRQNLEAAVKNDDWSALINAQTQETTPIPES
ncbi:MAG: GIY-YIG nuclease family protein [Leptolyngbyaceae bacterium]|nr:GIY-YIG nuclease family protein [Leptolyngbyaceae bacterium]